MGSKQFSWYLIEKSWVACSCATVRHIIALRARTTSVRSGTRRVMQARPRQRNLVQWCPSLVEHVQRRPKWGPLRLTCSRFRRGVSRPGIPSLPRPTGYVYIVIRSQGGSCEMKRKLVGFVGFAPRLNVTDGLAAAACEWPEW